MACSRRISLQTVDTASQTQMVAELLNYIKNSLNFQAERIDDEMFGTTKHLKTTMNNLLPT
jgi:hypothetical protein